MDTQFFIERAMYLIPLLLSLTVHEYAHAWAAYQLGDDTAARMGRLTLNPVVHMDPLGTFLLPMLGIPFGWAKPVPVNPLRFRRDITMPTGMAITAAAGPLSNVLLAVICAVIYGLWARLYPVGIETQPAVAHLLLVGIQMNVGLALFNMLPIPPLDGSRVIEPALPFNWRVRWSNLANAGPILLIVAIAVGNLVLDGPRELMNAGMFALSSWLAGS